MTPTDQAFNEWLVGGGELGELIRALDWANTPLGPREGWPGPLRTTVCILVESAFPMALFWGQQSSLLYNDAYRMLAGLEHPAALGRSADGAATEAIAAVMGRGEAVALEDQLFLLDRGGRVEAAYFTLCYSPVRLADGSIGGTLLILQETTARKASDAALEKMRGILAEGQRIAHLGSFEYVVDTKTTIWSDEEYRIYGLDPAGPSPSYAALLSQCIHPEDAELLHEAFSTALRTATAYELDHRIVRPDGSVRWVRDRALPYFDETGKLVRYVGATLDITEAKRAEEVLHDVDRRKNEFLAMLSHELRNPLAPIRNSLYILDRAPRGGEQARRAQAILERQIGHLTRLVDDLLDVSRIVRGKTVLQCERVDLCELVRRTAEDHRWAFVEGEIELEVAKPPSPVWVNGDRTRLAQVVGNLLQNAAKFTPEGGKTTVVVDSDAARGHARIQVKDTGRGIAPEVLPKLFEAFSQVDATLDREKGGLGLGLSLVKGLVEMHGGSVQAASDGPGKGPCFTIVLPLERVARVEHGKVPSHSRSPSRRVLIIEDNLDASTTLRDVLELEGHRVEVAGTGLEGVEKAHSFGPEVVLCDIGLPEMSGYEVAQALRADPDLAKIRLVALTGYAAPDDITRAKEAGFDAHLAKPARIEALAKVLSSVGS